MSAVTVDRSTAGLARVRLSRPEKLNALNEDVRRGLWAAFSDVADDAATRVVVIEGEGRCFSAGADLAPGPERPSEQTIGSTAPTAGADEPTWAQRRHDRGGWQRLLDLLESLPQVTVAGLHGHCIGGAALLAAACDIRVGDETVAVRIPELAIGIPLTWGGVPRLAREIGLPLTRDLVMTGRTMVAEEALRCGFVQRLVGAGRLEEGLSTVVDELLAMPAAPLAITKAMTAALGRAAMGAAAWADADVLDWSGREQESRQAARDYVRSRLRS